MAGVCSLRQVKGVQQHGLVHRFAWCMMGQAKRAGLQKAGQAAIVVQSNARVLAS